MVYFRGTTQKYQFGVIITARLVDKYWGTTRFKFWPQLVCISEAWLLFIRDIDKPLCCIMEVFRLAVLPVSSFVLRSSHRKVPK